MKLFAEETFGPVVSLYRFASEDGGDRAGQRDAVRLERQHLDAGHGPGRETGAEDPHGQRQRQRSVCRDLGFGGFADRRHEGVGLARRGTGPKGILKFTESQTIAVQRVLPIAPPWGMDAGTYARWMTRLLMLIRNTRLLG